MSLPRLSRHFVASFSIALIAAIGILNQTSRAQDQPSSQGGTPPTVQSILDDFLAAWDDTVWDLEFRTVEGKYMRPLPDPGMKARMEALRDLVALGDDAIPELVKSLESENATVRILVAQAIGFLGPEVPQQPLIDRIQSDQDQSVRLYAADSLGRIGTSQADIAVLANAEQHRDVKMHLNYAMERDGQPIDIAIVEKLKNWDSSQADTARVGEPAPEFTLPSVTGHSISLSDFKGKSAVVLVFVYGDT